MRAVALALAVALTGCKQPEPPPTPQVPSSSAKAAPLASVFSVDPVVVVEQVLDATILLPGELTPYEQVDIHPRASGFVRAVRVDRGSAVKKGDVLAKLDAPEIASQRAEAEAKVAGDKSTLDRLRAAQKQMPGAVAEHDIELAQAALRASSARVASLRVAEGYLVVVAPFDGIVTERNIHPGALVGPPTGGRGAPMLRMESVARLRLTVAVPEDQTSALKTGDGVEFGVRSWPQRKFKAQIARLAHTVDARTRTMPVELDVENADGALSAGAYASVTWRLRRPSATLWVPESAVCQGTERTFVVRIKDGAAEPVPVQRGISAGGLVEVFGSLRTGDTIARRGSEELKAGAPVTLRKGTK